MTAITPEIIATAKQRSLVALIGREVKLRPRGNEYVGLCPFHQEKTPSFYVNEKKGLYSCFGCGAGGDAIDYARHAYGLTFPEAIGRLAGDDDLGRIKITPRDQPEDNSERIRQAQTIWTASEPITGTIAEAYLRSRGITMPLPDTLRFHPYLQHSTGLRTPAMVAAIAVAPSRVIAAVHQTFIKPDGSDKIPLSTPRLTLGPAKGGAIRLSPWTHGPLVIAEGIETTLSAMQLFGLPGWSARSDGGIRSLVLPDEVRDVVICADNDANGVGQAVAEVTAEKWRGEGRRVRIELPECAGTDWNDVLRGQLGLGRPGYLQAGGFAP